MENSLSAHDDKRVNSHLRGGLAWLSFLLVGIALGGWWCELHAQAILFIGVEMLAAWGAVVAIIHCFYLLCVWEGGGAHEVGSHNGSSVSGPQRSSYALIWQWVLLLLAIALFWKIFYAGLANASSVTGYLAMSRLSIDTARRNAVFLLGGSAILYFVTNYTRIVQKKAGTTLLNPILHLSQIIYLACGASAILTFIFISTQKNYGQEFGWFLVYLALLLILEPLFRFVGRFYLPESQRRMPAPVGASLLLDTLSGSGRGLQKFGRDLENLIGMKVGEIWILGFMREAAEVVIFAGVILGWLSTCLTAVPLGSSGVLVSLGRYDTIPLAPGLHLSLPWPLGEIDIVEAERIHEISLGFEEDMDGPILWTQKHYSGEQNLLVGDGESLLVIDVRILYRVADPVAFLQSTSDASLAFKSMAGRELIQVTRSRGSFEIMTTDREQIASELRKGLQNEGDRLNLGLQIVFVGLKDAHPPIDVAPAYEQVIGAQEEKETTIDKAYTYEASILPHANAVAQRLVLEADAAKTKRVDQATGEASRFASLVTADHDAPSLFRTRLRYDALDETLLAPAKIIVGLSSENLPDAYLDLRSIKAPAKDIASPQVDPP